MVNMKFDLLKTVPSQAFSRCQGLRQLEIPLLESLSLSAFSGCDCDVVVASNDFKTAEKIEKCILVN